MKRIWDLAAFEMLRVLKRPQSYIVMFAMPLLFTLLFGSLLGGETPKTTMAWVDQDHSYLSKNYKEKLKDNTIFTLRSTTLAKAKEMLDDKKVSGIIIVEKNFEKQLLDGRAPQVDFQHGPENSSAIAINHVLNNIVDQMNIEVTGAKQEADWQSLYQSIDRDVTATANPITLEKIFKHKNQLEMSNTSARAAGFTIMFVMIIMISATGTILEAKRTGLWYRMIATPSSRFQILAGYFLSFFLVGWVQFAVLMVSSSLLFGVHWGNLAALVILVSAVLLAIVGLGLFIAGFVKTIEQQAALGNIVVASTCMLGGVYWPLDIVPKVMQKMAAFVPQKWAMDGFTELIARGGSVSDIILPVTVLLSFAALFIIVGMSRIRYE